MFFFSIYSFLFVSFLYPCGVYLVYFFTWALLCVVLSASIRPIPITTGTHTTYARAWLNPIATNKIQTNTSQFNYKVARRNHNSKFTKHTMPTYTSHEMFQMTDGQFQLVYNCLSFTLASMMASTIFFWLRLGSIAERYKSALVITGLVTFIAAYHYYRILPRCDVVMMFSIERKNKCQRK